MFELTRAVYVSTRGACFHPNLRVLGLNCYKGARDAKEIKNFLFDLEQYFKIIQPTKELKVAITTWYPWDDAKLWWQRRYEDIQQGLCIIDTWAELKNGLKA